MPPAQPRKIPLKKSASAPDAESDLYDRHLRGSWWDIVDKTSEAIFPQSKPGINPSTTSSSKAISQGNNLRSPIKLNAGVRSISSKYPSPPVVVAESVEAPPVTQKPRDPRGTTTKQRVTQDPPPAEINSSVTSTLRALTLSSSSMSGQRKEPQPQPPPRNVVHKVRPTRTVLASDSEEDEEEEEVSEMLTEPDSLPSTKSPSIFDYTPVSHAPLPLTMYTNGRKGQDSGHSGTSLNNGRKRPRLSGASDVQSQNSELSIYQMGGIFSTTLPSVRVRKENPVNKLHAIPLTFPLSPDAPSSVGFLRGKLGWDLNTVIIAHSAQTQNLMDKLRLSWGVQFELARGVTLRQWTWEEVHNVLQKKPTALVGSNAESAFKVRAIMQDRDAPANVPAFWEELDREQAAIIENKGRGLGLMGEWCGKDNWYGGRIQQVARLSSHAGKYNIHLEAIEMRRSHRFARFCGSRRILQLRISKDLIQKEVSKLRNLLRAKFALCGRLFVPLHVKENCLYMVETNEDWERQALPEFGDQYRISFSDFVEWHNPPQYNFNQALSKYVTRYALGLSTTVPVLEFEEKNMFFIDDIHGSDYRGGKASTEEIMTDGCGFINQTALIAINVHLNRRSLPVALQGRIAGAKGLWILHPTDESSEPKIWVRDSQNKVKHPKLDRAHRIFELVAPSHPSSSVTISRQSIVNLAFNEVPHEVLLEYVEKGLVEEIGPLLKWDHPKAHILLWRAIDSAGNVSRARLARTTAGLSRALGLTNRPWREGDVGETEAEFDEDRARDTGRNEYSGAPLGLHESALELFQAGFHPSTFKPLCDKLKWIIEQGIKSYVENYRIPLPESLSGFVIPDPIGILDEGEIYYRASENMVDPRTQQTFDVITGDVIVGRYPIRLASDLQKVRAVNKSELRQWPDVIIASTKGTRSLASLLSGGDMDGDELFLLREPEIVGPFQNKPFVPEPVDLLENFQKHVESVGQFCERFRMMSSAEGQAAFQEALLSLDEDRKGLYSMFHDNAVEKFGYDDPRTIRLAYMFNTLLDASKSGLKLADGIFQKDQKNHGRPFSEDFPYQDLESLRDRSECPPADPNSDAYILNKLRLRARQIGDALLEQFDDLNGSCFNKRDQDLAEPYESAVAFARRMYYSEEKVKVFENDLSKIRAHVSKAYDAWIKEVGPVKITASRPNAKKTSSAGNNVSKKAAMLFASPIDLEGTPNAEEIMASFAYCNRWESQFPLYVAFRKLCEIKAKKCGISPCIREIDEAKSVSSSTTRALYKYDVD